MKHMKIECSRQLSDIETEDLMHSARIMEACGELKGWAGFGMLYMTTKPGTWHFIDQKYKEGVTSRVRRLTGSKRRT